MPCEVSMSSNTIRVLSLLFLTASVLRAEAPIDGGLAQQQPVTPGEIEQLKRQIEAEKSSNVEVFSEYHTRSGDINSQLDFFRYGVRLNVRIGDAHLLASGSRTSYRTTDDILTATGTNVSLGLLKPLSENAETRIEVGLTQFSTSATTVTGLGSLTLKPSEKLRYSITLARSNVEESLLSAAGIRPVVGPFGGSLVGLVLENRLTASGSYRLPSHFDVFGEAGIGNREGDEVASNAFRRAGGGVGYNAVARGEEESVSLVRVSASAYYFGFDKDLFGFGGASLLDERGLRVPLNDLGSDGFPTVPTGGPPGVGGYFSPASFVSGVGRLDVRGRPDASFDYKVAGFLGVQTYTGSSSRPVVGVSGEFALRLGTRLSLPVSLSWDNVGPFHQFSVTARLSSQF
jgi:hypothetical protein